MTRDPFASGAAAGSVALDGEAGAEAPREPAVDIEARYQMGPLLGRGGMGRVTAAYDRVLGRDVAFKEILAPTPDLEARFRREARLTAELDHPGIVPVYDTGRTRDGRLFYTMRLVRGATLATLRKRGEPLVRLVTYLRDAARAVAHAHAHGVVHRDLKPDNVMVGDRGDVQVADWGLALRVAELDARTHGVVGTVGYIAPELENGAAWSPRADVWSLGRMLDELLGDARAPELRAIATRALASPEDRYLDAGELAEDLARWLDGRPVAAYRYTRAELVARFVRAFRAPLAVAGLALVITATLVGLAWRRAANERGVARAAEARLLVTQARQALQAGALPEAIVMAVHSDALVPSPAAAGVLAQARAYVWPRLVTSRPLDCDRVVPSADATRWVCLRPGGASLDDETTSTPLAGLILKAAFSPDGGRLALLDKARGLVVRDVRTGAETVVDPHPVDAGRLVIGVADDGARAFSANGGWARLATATRGPIDCSSADPLGWQVIELDGDGLLLARGDGAGWWRCDDDGAHPIELAGLPPANANDVLGSVRALGAKRWLRGTTEGEIELLAPGAPRTRIARLPRAATVDWIMPADDDTAWIQLAKGGALRIARGSGEVVSALPELDRGPVVTRPDGTVVSFGRTRRAVWRFDGARGITTHVLEHGAADVERGRVTGAIYYFGSHGLVARVAARGDAVVTGHVDAAVVQGGTTDAGEDVLWVPSQREGSALDELDARTLARRRTLPGILGKHLGWLAPSTLWVTGYGELRTVDTAKLTSTRIGDPDGVPAERRGWVAAAQAEAGGAWLLDEQGVISRFDTGGSRAVATHPGALLVASGPDGFAIADRHALLVYTADGHERARAPLRAEPTAIAISSGVIAIGYIDGGVTLLAADTLAERYVFATHGERVSAIVFGATADEVYTASWDHAVTRAALSGAALTPEDADAQLGLTLDLATARAI